MRLSIPFSFVSWRVGYTVSILSLETTSSFLRDFIISRYFGLSLKVKGCPVRINTASFDPYFPITYWDQIPQDPP
jgi:hypothetical protein